MEDELNVKMEQIRKEMEKYEDEGGSGKEESWKKTFNTLNEIKKLVHSQGTFSENEEFCEIKTEDIKILLIPFYQSELIQKFNENRESNLKFAIHFYEEFFKLLDDHDYFDKERKTQFKNLIEKFKNENSEDKDQVSSKPSMEEMSKDRDEKIKTYRYKKTLSEKLKRIEKEKDYDNSREFWIAYLELAWINTLENIRMIMMESDSLKFIKNQKKSGEYENQLQLDIANAKNSKMEMIQIKSPDDLNKLDKNSKLVKNLNMMNSCGDCNGSNNHSSHSNMEVSPLDHLIHKQVNARDYVFRPNNLPTMTLDEFAEKEMGRMNEAKLREEEAKQNMENDDSDNEEVADRKAYQARAWDDWKDLNEKGAGNKRG